MPDTPIGLSANRKRTWIRRGTIAQFAFGLVLVNLIWRCVRYTLAFPIWGDEAFVVINFIRRDFLGLVPPLEYGQVVPLGFMWAELAVTRVLGLSEVALRLVPFSMGVVSMLVFWRFSLKVVNRWSAMLAIAIFAASYYPVRHATEVKPYAGDLLIALALISLTWAVFEQPKAISRWLSLIVVAAAGVWLSYPSVFVASGVGLFITWILIRSPSRRLFLLWLTYGLGLGASFIVMFLICAEPIADSGWVPGSPETIDKWGAGFPLVHGLRQVPLWFLQVHTGNMMAYPVGGRNGGSILTFLLVLVGVWTLWRMRRGLLLLLLSPLPFMFVAAAMQRYPYGSSARLALHMAPAFCLLAGIGLSTVLKTCLPRRRIPGGFRIATLVMALIAIAGITRDILKPYKTFADQENRRVIHWLASQAGPNDQWVSFNAPGPNLPYADDIYLRGGHGARHRYYLYLLAPVPLRWGPAPADVASTPGGRTWLIVYKDDRAPFPEDALRRYMEKLADSRGKPLQYLFPLAKNQLVEIYAFPRSVKTG